jgi:copper chaperone
MSNFVSSLKLKRMENLNIQFKTNINCGGCVATVKPHLDNAEGICHWEIDTTNKDKILTVHSDGITREQVLEIVRKAGYTAEPLTT